MISWILLSCGILFNASANILLKVAARHSQIAGSPVSIFRLISDPYLLLGIISFGLALGAYSYSLIKFELSVAYPVMTSLGLVIVSIFSLLVFKENFTFVKAVGTVFVLVGVVLVAKP